MTSMTSTTQLSLPGVCAPRLSFMNSEKSFSVSNSEIRDPEMPFNRAKPMGSRHCPVSFCDLLKIRDRAAKDAGFQVEDMKHVLTHDGKRLFSIFNLGMSFDIGQSAQMVGVLRGSVDQAFRDGMIFGSNVTCCTNLELWSGDHMAGHKNTKNAPVTLYERMLGAFGRVEEQHTRGEKRIELMQAFRLKDESVRNDILVRACQVGAISAWSTIPKVIHEYQTSRHPEFQDRNLWSLFNAYTEVSKKGFGREPFNQSERTGHMQELVDEVINLEEELRKAAIRN